MNAVKGILCITVFLIAVSEIPSIAEETGNNEWEWTIVPYVWIPSMKGHLIIGHEVPRNDVGVDEIIDTPAIDGMLHLEARKGAFGLFLQSNYFKFDNEQGIHGVNVDINVTGWIFEFGGFYRLGEWGNKRPGILDLIIGGRYWSATAEVAANSPVPGVRLESTQGDHVSDPLVGLRFGTYVTNRIAFTLWGDIGGFGVNNTNFEAIRSWQALGFLGYDFNDTISLQVGYRALGLNIRDKNLSSNNEMKITAQGPVVGLSFRF